MTGPGFVYPAQSDRETGAEYYARVHAMGLPYPWERDKAVPPGPITVTHEWTALPVGKTPNEYTGWVSSEDFARTMHGTTPVTIWRRTRWTAVGPWQGVRAERPDCSCPDNTFDRACPFHGDTDHRVGDSDA